jgi:hypothetical protein
VKQAEKINALLGDVAFPLMGYFFWNWNFYFILLYFILDQVARTIFLPWRLKLTQLKQLEKIKMIAQSSILLFSELFLIHLFLKVLIPDIHFQKEISNFIHYSDMGIEQGYILLPLLILGEWLRMKQDLKTGIVGSKQLNNLVKNRHLSFFRISFFSFFLGVQFLISLKETMMIFVFFLFISVLVFYPFKISLSNSKT